MKYNYAFNAVRFEDGTLLVSLLPDVRTEYAGDNKDGWFYYDGDAWYKYEKEFSPSEMQERMKQKDLRVAEKLEEAKNAFRDYVKLLALLGLYEEEILKAKGVPDVLVSEVKNNE